MLSHHIEHGLQARLKYRALVDIQQLVAAAAAKPNQKFTITLALVQAYAGRSAIAKRSSCKGREQLFWLYIYTGITFELVQYLLLFVKSLRINIKMLQITTTTLIEMGAGGLTAIKARVCNLEQFCLVVAFVYLCQTNLDPLSRQYPCYESGLAVVAGNAATFMAQPIHRQLKWRITHDGFFTAPGSAKLNLFPTHVIISAL
jgi:hypothetical protein